MHASVVKHYSGTWSKKENRMTKDNGKQQESKQII